MTTAKLTADVVAIAPDTNGQPHVLVIERKYEPFQGFWAFPGGHIDDGEEPEAAAHRELDEETGLTVPALRLFSVYAAPGRDPRGRYATWVYVAHLDTLVTPTGADDAADAVWVPLASLADNPQLLGFDHGTILTDVVNSGITPPKNSHAEHLYFQAEETLAQVLNTDLPAAQSAAERAALLGVLAAGSALQAELQPLAFGPDPLDEDLVDLADEMAQSARLVRLVARAEQAVADKRRYVPSGDPFEDVPAVLSLLMWFADSEDVAARGSVLQCFYDEFADSTIGDAAEILWALAEQYLTEH